MDHDDFEPLSASEHADALAAGGTLALALSVLEYPPAVAESLKVTFKKFAGSENLYRLEIVAEDRSFEDGVTNRDPAAYTLYYIGRRLASASMNIDGKPFTVTQDFNGTIDEKIAEVTTVVTNLAPHLLPKFKNKPQP